MINQQFSSHFSNFVRIINYATLLQCVMQSMFCQLCTRNCNKYFLPIKDFFKIKIKQNIYKQLLYPISIKRTFSFYLFCSITSFTTHVAEKDQQRATFECHCLHLALFEMWREDFYTKITLQ